MKRFIIFILLATSCFGAWDRTKPSSSTSLRNSNPEILANWSALEVALSQDHTFAEGSPDGKHTQITFTDPVSTPGNVTDEGVLYIKDVDPGTATNVIELHFKDESGNEIQLTSIGNRIANATYFTGTTNAGTGSVNIFKVHTDDTIHFGQTINVLAGFDLIGSATSDIDFGSGNFTVAGATGNTVIAGTLDVTGNIDPTTYETTNGGFLNSDSMSGVADNTVASSDSIKNYVDTGAWNPASAYAGGESITFPNGLIMKHGKVTTNDTSGTITFSTGGGETAFSNVVSAQLTHDDDITANTGSPTVTSLGTTTLLWVKPASARAFYWQVWGN